MADFNTLIADIHAYLAGDHSHEDFKVEGSTARNIIEMSKRLATHTLDLANHRGPEAKSSKDHTIRMSEVGEPCIRKLIHKWYLPVYGTPPYSENPNPTLPVKFVFGDYMEELVLFLAQEAGHKVTNRQGEVINEMSFTDWKAIGHIDAMIDDYVVDVKSAADVSFQKYKREGLTEDNDTFGYRFQLDSYSIATGNHKRAFIFINKHDGELLVIDRSNEPHALVYTKMGAIVKAAEDFRASGTYPPPREPVPDPKGYGDKLDVVCSYCPFKYYCWYTNGGFQGYLISGRPVYYTKTTTKGDTYLGDKKKLPPPEAYQNWEEIKIRGKGGATVEDETAPF